MISPRLRRSVSEPDRAVGVREHRPGTDPAREHDRHPPRDRLEPVDVTLGHVSHAEGSDDETGAVVVDRVQQRAVVAERRDDEWHACIDRTWPGERTSPRHVVQEPRLALDEAPDRPGVRRLECTGAGRVPLGARAAPRGSRRPTRRARHGVVPRATPRPISAASRFAGPSAPAIAGVRIAPVTTNGSSRVQTRSARNAISSMVSVPCTTTTPSDEVASASSSSSSRSAKVKLALGIRRKSRTSTSMPSSDRPGTEASSSSPPRRATALDVPDMLIVPPRKKTVITLVATRLAAPCDEIRTRYSVTASSMASFHTRA